MASSKIQISLQPLGVHSRSLAQMKTTILNNFKRAKDLGYHIAVLQASSEGYPLYQQLGYQECGNFCEYKKIK